MPVPALVVVRSAPKKSLPTTNEIRYWRCWRQIANNGATNSRIRTAVPIVPRGTVPFVLPMVVLVGLVERGESHRKGASSFLVEAL
jgi:hypothetical protein